MISAGEFSIEKCSENVDCQNAFNALKEGCKKAHEEDGEESVAQCIDQYVKSDSMPPFKEDDPVVQLGLITKETYTKMVLMKATGEWPTNGASAPEEASEEAATAEKPAGTEEEKKEEEEPAESKRNYMFSFDAKGGLYFGEYSFTDANPGQESVGVGLGGAQFEMFITPFIFANGLTGGFHLIGGLMGQSDQEHPGTSMVDSMPIIGKFGGGLAGQFEVANSFVLKPYVDFLGLIAPKMAMGSEGTISYDENGQETENSLLAPGFGLGLNAVYMFTPAIGIGGSAGFDYFFTTGRTQWEGRPNNLSMPAGYVQGLFSIAWGSKSGGEAQDVDKAAPAAAVEAEASEEAEAGAETEVDMPPVEEPSDEPVNAWEKEEETEEKPKEESSE